MIANLMLLAGLGLSPEPLDWLVGKWCTEPAKGRTTCETWQPMGADHVMRGETVTISTKGERREPMRITGEADRLVFHAEPPGQAPTDFAAKQAAAQSIEFVNAAHDYPQRIRYELKGDKLEAEISRIDGSKPIRWIYSRENR